MNTNTTAIEPIEVSAAADETSIANFLGDVEARLAMGGGTVQVDCAALDRVSSSHVRALWLARESCIKAGSDMSLVNAGQGLIRVLQVLDLADLFVPTDDVPLKMAEVIPASVADIDRSMEAIVSFLTQNGVPEITAFEVQTIFYEVCTNIRRHGELPDAGTIDFQVQLSEARIDLTFQDGGVQFDPTQARGRDLNIVQAGRDFRKNGFGLAMIDRLSNSMRYTRANQGRNILRISKNW